jgi:putative spermidine/putrescine transport system substrate-binding protein
VASLEPAFQDLKEFNKNVVITGGNVGTLDGLNRGEIWMGPVWVDMFFTFMNEGKLDPKTRMIIPDPGMPGQPMYFVIPKNAPHPDLARKFVEYVTGPAVQAKDIVIRFNWYPGIDGSFLKGAIPQETYDKIYRDVTPQDLQKKGLSFPLADYYSAVLESYETWAQ